MVDDSFETTVDGAFAHLADQVAAIREKQARSPLTVAVTARAHHRTGSSATSISPVWPGW
ncbi:hypothetical protein EAH80_27605 [Mycobacterium hodleri]|uniref:Uncharacterized protein n=1 Tax=Mycolicibacterium hodleri TaxID=49897 RepID=A0A502DVG1_9MYCO|nr:hypothetical protein EAH80_27605 [Mycolicibacterium hodleri]